MKSIKKINSDQRSRSEGREIGINQSITLPNAFLSLITNTIPIRSDE